MLADLALAHNVWMFLALALPVPLVLHYSLGREIGHGYLIAAGVFFYLVLPFYAYGHGSYEDGPGEAIWAPAFEYMYRQSTQVFEFLLAAAIAYGLGQLMLWRVKRRPNSLDRPLNKHLLSLLLASLTLVCATYTFLAREQLFAGYSLTYRADLMGPLATVNLTALLAYLNLQQWGQAPRLRVAYGMLLLANSVVLLSMGGRLYVLAVLVGLALAHVNSPRGRRPAARLSALLIILAGTAGLALVGLWRLGTEFSLQTFKQIVLAEPVLTSISLGSMHDCPTPGLFELPRNFLMSLLNFIPSAFFPGKEEFLLDHDPIAACLDAPFGATHLGAAMLLNFGPLGSLLFIVAFSVLLKKLRGRGAPWWLHTYLCSLLPFMLFRDGFLIFNKAFFASGLLLAVLLVWASRLLDRPR